MGWKRLLAYISGSIEEFYHRTMPFPLAKIVSEDFVKIVDFGVLNGLLSLGMKKGVLLFIVLTALCLTVLIAGVSSGKVCPKKSFLCSAFTLAFAASAVSTRVEPDTVFSKTTHPDIIYHQEFLSSIFHPPKHIS